MPGLGPTNQIVTNIVARIVAGLVNVVFGASYAALIFSGPLSDYLPFGISSALVSASVLAIIVALTSSFSFAIGGPDSNASAFMAVIISGTTASLISAGSAQAVLPTVMMTLALGTIATGLVLLVGGTLRLGRWVRFSPYPVVAGFLASSGWLFSRGAFVVMTGVPLGVSQFGTLIQPDMLIRWLPGLLFALVTLFLMHRYVHFLVIPGLIVGAVGVFYLLLWIGDMSLVGASEYGLLYDSFSKIQFWWPPDSTALTQTDWAVIVSQSGSLLALIFVVGIVMLLNATGLELAADFDADLDRELKSAGISNIVTGLFGGFIGAVSSSRTLLSYRAGASSRVAGVVAALFAAVILLRGAPLLAYLPKSILGGLLLYLGLSLLLRWLYKTWFQLNRIDYAIIWIILLIVATIGFLEGIGVGIIIASVIFTLSYSQLSVIKYELSGAEHRSNRARSFQQEQLLQGEGQQTHILCLQGYLFFGTANSLLDHIQRRLADEALPPIRHLLIDFCRVNGLDVSALMSFAKLRRIARVRQIELVFAGLSTDIAAQFRQNGIIEAGHEHHVLPDLDRGLEWCEEQILGEARQDQPQLLPLAQRLEELLPSAEQVSRFMSYLEVQEVPAGQALIAEGESSEALYLVDYGQFTVIRELGDGQTRRIRTMGAGTIIGELGLYRQAVPMASVVADRPSRVYRLSRVALDRMQTDDPALAARFHQFIARLIAERLVTTSETVDMLLG